VFRVPYYPVDVLEGEEGGRQVTRQGFARGLCVVSDRVFASGASPLTITLHDLDAMQTTLSINLGTDVRQALHSLAVWPFS
jgi:hypothetical protein